MAITLAYIIETFVLILNAATILNEERFLKKYGWDKPDNQESLDP